MRTGLPPEDPEPPAGADAGWRERAVERSLRTARERAVSRSERFTQVATELLFETGSLDFTVQELVERSKMSLRSFYQHFASKDELLLAVFEEAIKTYVSTLRAIIDTFDDPVDRLRAYVTNFYAAGGATNNPASQALSRFLMVLTQTNPSELARVLQPQIALLNEILEAGATSGQIRRDMSPHVLTLLVTHTLMAAVEMNVMGMHLTGDAVSADELWEFCAGGVLAG